MVVVFDYLLAQSWKDFCNFTSQVGVKAEKWVWCGCVWSFLHTGANQITTFINGYAHAVQDSIYCSPLWKAAGSKFYRLKLVQLNQKNWRYCIKMFEKQLVKSRDVSTVMLIWCPVRLMPSLCVSGGSGRSPLSSHGVSSSSLPSERGDLNQRRFGKGCVWLICTDSKAITTEAIFSPSPPLLLFFFPPILNSLIPA